MDLVLGDFGHIETIVKFLEIAAAPAADVPALRACLRCLSPVGRSGDVGGRGRSLLLFFDDHMKVLSAKAVVFLDVVDLDCFLFLLDLACLNTATSTGVSGTRCTLYDSNFTRDGL